MDRKTHNSRYHSAWRFAIDHFWDLIVEDYKRPQKLVLKNIIENIEIILAGESTKEITDHGRNEETGEYFIYFQNEEHYL